MKKVNKIIATGMALIMAGMMTTGIYAAEGDSGDQDGSMTLNATVPSTYELSIPITSTNIDYNERTQKIGTLCIKGNIEASKTVTVSVTEKKNFKTPSNPADTTGIPFKVTESNMEFTSAVWTPDEIRDASKEVTLYLEFEANAWTLAHSGDYVGSIVFLAEMN